MSIKKETMICKITRTGDNYEFQCLICQEKSIPIPFTLDYISKKDFDDLLSNHSHSIDDVDIGLTFKIKKTASTEASDEAVQ